MLRLLTFYIVIVLGVKLGMPASETYRHVKNYNQSFHLKEVQHHKGDTFRVTLPVLSSTGSSWLWRQQQGISLVGQEIVKKSSMTNTGDLQAFTFKSNKIGMYTIDLSYRTTWEHKATEVYKLVIVVSD